MPTYQPPHADADRHTLLNKIPATDAGDRLAGKPLLEEALVAEITEFLTDFNPAHDAIAGSLSHRMKEVREREEARAKLDTHVRDFWEGLKRRAHRTGQPAEVLTFYGLPADGTVPGMSAFDALVGFADRIVKGEVDAVAAGFPAMANPSAAEVAAVLAEARLEAKDVPTADRQYDDAQAAIAALRPEADRLIEEGIAALRYQLRRMDAPSQRRVQRRYGYTFAYLPGEPTEEEPAEPAPAA